MYISLLTELSFLDVYVCYKHLAPWSKTQVSPAPAHGSDLLLL